MDEAKSSITVWRTRIGLLEEEIDRMNDSIKNLIKSNLETEKAIESEEKFAEEKRPAVGFGKFFVSTFKC